jgi:hypothetical protein
MKKNENIFISLQIQKDTESKGLCLSVQFDRNAPNISLENETIDWCPTVDEIDFIAEAFELIGGNTTIQRKVMDEPQEIAVPPEEETTEQLHRSSEIRIAPLPNDMTLEETEELDSSRVKKKEPEDSIFIQADEKKIDEILKRKKPVVKDDYATDSDEKTIIDRMLKQKKKK